MYVMFVSEKRRERERGIFYLALRWSTAYIATTCFEVKHENLCYLLSPVTLMVSPATHELEDESSSSSSASSPLFPLPFSHSSPSQLAVISASPLAWQ